MTPDDLKQTLSSMGWKFGKQPFHSGVDWYAYKRTSLASCTSNERSPYLVIRPSCQEVQGTAWSIVDFSIRGEVGKKYWLNLEMYSVEMDYAIKATPDAECILSAAWEAAVAESTRKRKLRKACDEVNDGQQNEQQNERQNKQQL